QYSVKANLFSIKYSTLYRYNVAIKESQDDDGMVCHPVRLCRAHLRYAGPQQSDADGIWRQLRGAPYPATPDRRGRGSACVATGHGIGALSPVRELASAAVGAADLRQPLSAVAGVADRRGRCPR